MAFRNSFSTIKVEGGLLSSDYLRQIASGNAQVPGLSPGAYHLSSGQRLSDAISNAWNIMRGRWTAFKDVLKRLPEKDYAIAVTRDRFLFAVIPGTGLRPAPNRKSNQYQRKRLSDLARLGPMPNPPYGLERPD
jgi:hypothetical protein